MHDMAEKLETPMPFAAAANGIYPWDEWLDGNVWSLTPGVDYSITTQRMQTAAGQAARRRNLSIRTRGRDGKLLIQALSRMPAGSR